MTTTTPRTDILSAVTDIVATVLAVPSGGLSPDLDLRGIDGVDSVKVLRVVATAEQHFDVELEDDTVFALATIAGLATAIEKAAARP
ncbi:acyl carrier protein [Streptomyces sp. TBY4]|uniref:acyl carrier protein n=1 Tax=Streptomyces sp. TBY4 TaxID=2962030 RepID=UPI0020B724FF|nr:acyl carrier protein [Streptomyces sp. TBY4]MCP3757262.1 acyl carrier protein [Streptomyces sp. TBY4]